MKFKNRVLSMLLVIVMVCAMLPSQVFASSFGNMTSGSTVTVTLTGGAGSVAWNNDLNSMNGYKISVWYAPIDLAKSDGKTSPVYQWGTGKEFQIGNNVYWRDLYLKNKKGELVGPSVWGSGNIYKMTTLGETWGKSIANIEDSYFQYSAMERYRNGELGVRTDYFDIVVSDYVEPYKQYLNEDKDKASENEGQKALRDWINRIYDMNNPSNPNMTSGARLRTGEDLRVPFAKAMKPKPGDGKVASGEYIKSYFLNPVILNDISYATRPKPNETKSGLWLVSDFLMGRYKGNAKDGEYLYTQGQYKIFIEPVMFRPYAKVSGVMTWREMMAEYNEAGSKTSKTAISNIGIAAHQIANALRIENEDPVLNIKGTPLKYSKDMAGSFEGAIEMSKDELNGLGVGIVTSPSLNSYHPGPDILKTYVMVDSVDADGTVHYKKAAPTTKETAQFNIDEDGNITKVPVFENIKGVEGGVALLNDVVTTDKEFTVSDTSEWLDTALPVNIGVDLKPSSDDIAGYVTGMITGSELFIDTYRESIKVDDDVLASINAVKKVYEGLQEKNAGAANETTQIAQLPVRSGSPSTLIIKIVDAIPYVYFGDVKLGQIVNNKVEKIIDEKADATGGIGIVTPANNLILRYILKPTPSQINLIEIVDEKTNTSTFLNGGIQDLAISGDTVTVQKPSLENLNELLGEPKQVEWVTNSEYPIKDINTGVLPPKSDNGMEGGPSDTVITGYPKDPLIHNLYVKWRVVVTPPTLENALKYTVPEWRLSKKWDAYTGVPKFSASMQLPIIMGCCSTSLSPEEDPWNYTTRNPNGQLTLPDHQPDNLTMKALGSDWLHSETVHSGNKPVVSLARPDALVPISANLNAIKSTSTSGLKVANWLDKDSVTGLLKYDVKSDTKGVPFSQSEYTKPAELTLDTYNLATYKNEYTKNTALIGHRCGDFTNTIYPSNAIYNPAKVYIDMTFDRYIQQNTDSKKLQIKPEVTSNNTKTTLKYQVPNKDIKIYPEYGMLFANDGGTESIKWVVGDQGRLINPVVYQTLEHKVYVIPTSTGVAATDSRAITNAKKIGEGNKQVFYKGSAVTSAFQIQREENNKQNGILTVKTFALDIENKDLKSAWGNSGYNSKAQHDALTKKVGSTNVTGTEKLLIDSLPYSSLDYTGAEKRKNDLKYTAIDYDKSTVTTFTHDLVVRGGALIGVNLQNRSDNSKKFYTMSELKTVDAPLYEAILNMNLYNESNNRENTVFSTFEHLTGDILSEKLYEDKLEETRQKGNHNKPTGSDSKVIEGKGWYSEDTTVLVIKEYVTNYTVPSTSFSDKISMSVKGLDSPANKNLFFSVLGKGYTYLKYNLPLNNLYEGIALPDTNAYFEFTSYPSDTENNGKQETNYLVPNASVSDSTNLS